MSSNPLALGAHSKASSTVYNPSLPLVTPEMYGAVGDGVTDDFTALTTALSFLEAQTTGGTLYLTKIYGISAQLNITTTNISIVGVAPRSTGFVPLSNSMTCLTLASSYCNIRNIGFLNNGSKTNTIGLLLGSVIPAQTTTRIDTNSNVIDNIYYKGLKRARVMAPGPRVLGADSTCSFNGFYNETFQNCIQSMAFLVTPTATPGSADENNTYNFNIFDTSGAGNSGIAIYQGGQNNFYGGYIQGILYGTDYFATPTAIYIGPLLGGRDNSNNRFFGVSTETAGVSRSIDNWNAFTEIYGGTMITNNAFTGGGPPTREFPAVYIHPEASGAPSIQPGFGIDNGSSTSPTNWVTAASVLSGNLGAQVLTGPMYSRYGISGSVVNAGTFTITIPTTRPAYLLSISTNLNSTTPHIGIYGTDGAGTPSETVLAAGQCTTTCSANTITVTNTSGSTGVFKWCLLQLSPT